MNAKILLGYVYTHQSRYKEAEREFNDVASSGTRNLWLWANWGQLLAMQNKDEQALEKYRQAVAGERTFDTYDRARLDAYRSLFRLLGKRKQFDEMDTLYKRQTAEFTKSPCLASDHAWFRLSVRDDVEGASGLAKAAIDHGCDEAEARTVLGAAYYMAWASLEGAPREQAMAQAHVFLPEGPGMYYTLARSDSTAKIIKKLVANGTPLTIRDNEKFTALAYALRVDDIDAARRLIQQGAKATETVGDEPVPVAILPLMNQSVRGVTLMQQSGVNYGKLRWRGMSGLDWARRTQNQQLLNAMERAASPTM